MTARQLDELLQRWEDHLNAMTANLTALYEHPVYVTLAGTLRQPPMPLVGPSRVAAAGAVARVRTLMVQAAEIRRVVDEAGKLRARAGLLNPGALEEAAALLEGESLRLDDDADASPDAGTLLGGVPRSRRVRPRDLLARMEVEFAQARGVIQAIDAAWQDADGAAAGDALTRCEKWLGSERDTVLSRRLEDARALWADLRERHRLDPLGTGQEFATACAPTLARLETDLRAHAACHEECQNGLAEGRAWLETTAKRIVQVEELLAERDLKTRDPANVGLPAGTVREALSAWLDKLADSAGRGACEPVLRALTAWRCQAEAFENTLAAVESQARGILAERLELRGRLDALHAKAAAAGRAEEPILSSRLTVARKVLYARPTSMPEARSLVEAYRAAFYTP